MALGVGRVPVKLGGVAQENGQLRRCTPRLFPPRLDTDCIRIFCTSISSSLLLVVLRVPPRAIVKFSTPLFFVRFDIVSGRSQFLSFASWSKYAAPIAPSFLRPVFFSDGRNGGGVKMFGRDEYYYTRCKTRYWNFVIGTWFRSWPDPFEWPRCSYYTTTN